MMPHPERGILLTKIRCGNPKESKLSTGVNIKTRKKKEGAGLEIFKNTINYFKNEKSWLFLFPNAGAGTNLKAIIDGVKFGRDKC